MNEDNHIDLNEDGEEDEKESEDVKTVRLSKKSSKKKGKKGSKISASRPNITFDGLTISNNSPRINRSSLDGKNISFLHAKRSRESDSEEPSGFHFSFSITKENRKRIRFIFKIILMILFLKLSSLCVYHGAFKRSWISVYMWFMVLVLFLLNFVK